MKNDTARLRYARKLGQYRRTPDDQPRFTMLELAINGGCNFSCQHCSASELTPTAQFSLDELDHLFQQAAAAGFLTVVMVGGEPTLYRDLDKAIALVARHGMLPALISNASRISAERLETWINAGLATICFSLHGFSADSHDAFVRVPGSFAKVMAAIDLAKQAGLGVAVSVTPTHALIASGEFARLLEFLRVNDIAANFNYPAVAGRYANAHLDLLTPAELAWVKAESADLRQWSDFHIMGVPEAPQKCIAAKNGIYVSVDGDVMPCAFIHVSYGNWRSDPLAEILDRMAAEPVFKRRHTHCLVGEDPVFVRDYIQPIYAHGNTRPLDFRRHPTLQSDRGEIASPAYDRLYRAVTGSNALFLPAITRMRAHLEATAMGYAAFREDLAAAILTVLDGLGETPARLGSAYRRIVTAFLRNQGEYRRTGRYPAMAAGLDAIKAKVYDSPAYMTDYMLHLAATYLLWPNKHDLFRTFQGEFVMRLADDSEVLEVGVGHGLLLAEALRGSARRGSGVDFSPTSLDLARRFLRCRDIADERAELLNADVTRDLPGRRWDAIILSEVIEHVEDADGLLRALRDRLRPGGAGLFLVTALNTATDDHLQVYACEDDVRDLIARTGWTIAYERSFPDFALAGQDEDQRKADRVPAAYAALLHPA